jgi:hypothetical protein
MIGMSLSFCVKDILNGEVDLKDVEKIIAGTNMPKRDIFEEAIKTNYAPVYWKKNPKKGVEIALELWDSGKLDQPRTRGEEHPGVYDGIWV